MKKSVRIILLVLAVALLFTACKGTTPTTTTPPASNAVPPTEAVKPTEPAKKAKERLVFTFRNDFATQDVQNTPSINTKSIYYLIYNTLVERDVPTNKIIPALAETWTQNSPTELVFNLRKGVKFHDGSDFTAADVKFTFEKALASKGSASKLSSLQSVEVTGDYTVKLTLKAANMDILDLLTDPSLSIQSKTAHEKLGDEKGIQQGTGPYKYAEWKQGSYLDLEANPDYWGEAPLTPKLRYQYIGEAASRLIGVKSGDLDFCQEVPVSELANIAKDPNLQLITYPSATVRYLAFNVNEAPMDNPDVRKAIAYAINRQEILEGVYLGNAIELNNIMHSSNAYYSKIEGTNYDVAKAKELLAKAGYANGLTITLVSNNVATDQAVDTVIQGQLSEVGITVKIEPMENAGVTAVMSSGKGYHMCNSTWSGYSFGPDNGIRQMLYSNGANNYAHYKDPKMDQMIDEAITLSDQTARMAAYKAIEEYSDEVMVVYPISVENYVFVARKSVENLVQPNGPIINLRSIVSYE